MADDGRAPLLWLEITDRCQLSCLHCYAESGPFGGHGDLTDAEWCAIIDQARDLGFGQVTFIGGEPTLHPGLPALVRWSLHRGLSVVIYSNLFHLSMALWEVAAQPRVRLRTTYYSDLAEQHDAITGVRGSHARTSATLVEAARRGINVDAALVSVALDQHLGGAYRWLRQVAIPASGPYPVRAIGRASNNGSTDDIAELCGRCAGTTLAVDCRGAVRPCVMARGLVVGDIRTTSMATILGGESLREARRRILAKSHRSDSAADTPCSP